MARQFCSKIFSSCSKSCRLVDNTCWVIDRSFAYKGSLPKNCKATIAKRIESRGIFDNGTPYISDDVKKLQINSEKTTKDKENVNSNKSDDRQPDKPRLNRPRNLGRIIANNKKHSGSKPPTKISDTENSSNRKTLEPKREEFFYRYGSLVRNDTNSSASEPPGSDMKSEEDLKDKRSSEPRPKAREIEIKVDKPPVKDLGSKDPSKASPPQDSPIKRDQTEKEEEYFYRSGNTFKYDTEHDSDIEYPSHGTKPNTKKDEDLEHFYRSGNYFKSDTDRGTDELSLIEKKELVERYNDLIKENKLNKKHSEEGEPSQDSDKPIESKKTSTNSKKSRKIEAKQNQLNERSQKEEKIDSNSKSQNPTSTEDLWSKARHDTKNKKNKKSPKENF